MSREMTFATRQETLLWRGVIARTIQDWLSGPLRPKREAERYLFENSVDLSSVCESAGIDLLKLRTCLNKVRGRTLEDVLGRCRMSDVLLSQPERRERTNMPSIMERELIEIRHEWVCSQCRCQFYNPGCTLTGLTLSEIM